MKAERRLINTQFETKTNESGQATEIRGYGAVFNQLSENLGGFREQIAPGAFDGVLDDDVRGLINHDSNLILGRNSAGTLRLGIDDRGLSYEIDLPDTSYARDLGVSMARGDISQSSFGFFVEHDDWNEDSDGRVVRTITKVGRLLDVSPVTYPAYPQTSSEARDLVDVDDASYQQYLQARKAESDARERQLKMISVGV